MRSYAALAIALVLPAAAPAHFLFVLQPASDGTMEVVWAAGPAADAKVGTESLTAGAAKVYAGAWTDALLNPSKAEGVWRSIPNSGAAVATAKAEYGLVNRGENHVYLVCYLAKWAKAVESTPPEATLPVELTAVRGSAGFHFLATQGTKPLAQTDVTVYEPGSGKVRTVKTDGEGRTPSFSTGGGYAARVFWNDATAGEYEGRKYRGTYYYSTLTTDYRP